MSKKIKCSELGFQNCDFVAEGETAGDVVREIVEHLRSEHDIDLPDAEVILKGKMTESLFEQADKATQLVITRLTEKLNIDSSPEDPKPPKPVIGLGS
jgi:predicted small metal-binding protein